MSIKEKLQKGIYLLEDLPPILEITGYEGIFINKNLQYPIEIDPFENIKWQREKLKIDKLKVINKGDWELTISMINTEYFENRDKLDDMLIADTRLAVKKEPRQNIKRISIQKALDYIYTQLWINMEYYMKNRNELETDLMRQVSDLELKDEQIRQRIEQELFYKLMLKIFGSDEKAVADDTIKPDDSTIVDLSDDDNDDENNRVKVPYSYEKAYMINEFHKYLDGNYMYATARRGDYYLIFDFGS
ncbi:unnamed protein product [Brachionus calyciflorus]|uniref:Uncharacterized protein n=1 Tax=Brachionus calyciflorus TaxID=104777 RepID=A0A814NZC1_9BILA|nr:unnamed protein product [Brachionus calyciflorus]